MSDYRNNESSIDDRIARLRTKKEFFQKPEAIAGLGTTWASFYSNGTSGTIEIQDDPTPDQQVPKDNA